MNPLSSKIYTLGYQNLSIEQFCGILNENNITLVADIRENPYSRNRDFSKKALVEHLRRAGIDYMHFPELGSPPDLRKQVRENQNYKLFFTLYADYLDTQSATLSILYNMLFDNTICLLCYEHNIAICHRRIVAEKLAGMAEPATPIEIIHL